LYSLVQCRQTDYCSTRDSCIIQSAQVSRNMICVVLFCLRISGYHCLAPFEEMKRTFETMKRISFRSAEGKKCIRASISCQLNSKKILATVSFNKDRNHQHIDRVRIGGVYIKSTHHPSLQRTQSQPQRHKQAKQSDLEGLQFATSGESSAAR